MGERQIEARLYWGDDLEAVTYTTAAPDLRVEDLGLPPIPESDTPITGAAGGLVRDIVVLGDFHVELAFVAREHAVAPRSRGDGRLGLALLVALALHSLFAAVAFRLRATEWEEAAGARAAMQDYLAAIDARASAGSTPETVPPQVPPPEDKGGANAAKNPSGMAGNPTRTNDDGRAKESKGSRYHVTHTGEPGGELASFGMIGLALADRRGENAGSSPWAKDLGPAAMGNMFGVTIDDAMGMGGQGLTGTGEGGGGKGDGISLGSLTTGGSGTCGDDCTGGGHGFRSARGARVTGWHQTRTISMRCPIETNCTPTVHGRLPPEAVQRVVRASFGRFRACYEEGLRRDPTLEGRVAVKFVIGRDGSVVMASGAERSLPDESVASCVVRRFGDLGFPEPEGGIVTVVYPIVFSTSP